MATPITEKILGNNTLYTDKYYNDTICLAKSILFTCDKEARLYNDYIGIRYPTFTIDLTDKTTWRYYRHLSGQLHPLDPVVTVTSLDNATTIEVTSDNLKFHTSTRLELQKLGLYYAELVNRFPEQELYIKSIIATSPKVPIESLISYDDYTITHYNADLIEDNEDDIIYRLQDKLNNYKVRNLISYYALNDNLFMASQYHILYNFIVLSLLGIRLKNAKTIRAHSYHVLNYLASNHGLDTQYPNLTTKQALFLYRNLLYLNNHSGSNEVFNVLIQKLFTDRNISVLNYRYKQQSELNADYQTQYVFYQEKLNNDKLSVDQQTFTLEQLLNKEVPLAPSNQKQHDYHIKEVDNQLYNTLQNKLQTKDLETVVVDNSDSVREKLIPLMVDYWVYLIKTNRIDYLVTVTDPSSNNTTKLSTKDLFKLFIVLYYFQQDIKLTHFPDYLIKRVFKETHPTLNELTNHYFNVGTTQLTNAVTLLSSIPYYRNIYTSYMFYQFIDQVYQTNLNAWLHESNLSDPFDAGQYANSLKLLHQDTIYEFNDETVDYFLDRVKMIGVYSLSVSQTQALIYSLLNSLFDNRLGQINQFQSIQKALTEVFQCFNSYTTQIIENYSATSFTLVGPEEPRYRIAENLISRTVPVENFLMTIEPLTVHGDLKKVQPNPTLNLYTQRTDTFPLETMGDLSVGVIPRTNRSIDLGFIGVMSVTSTNSPPVPSSDDQLSFLAFNL